ncbi:MAG: polymerase sigma-70 factor, subfamily [Actinomycetota bacterium]|jgi:RNA polymerase sigma-70 factor (ECF subfamily)|nr:polymerase sigma-70 factor, subfamily [Actinomycetota bacterium]
MAFAEIDEKLLVRAYQAGDERAFDAIVRTQHQALYAHAMRRLNQHEAAEDAVQDTLLRAYRALPNLDGDLALRAWLHRILTNVCHDEGNRRRRNQGLVERVGALPEELADDPVDEAVLHDTVRIMSEALRELPESYREALVLRYVDGLSFREVAEATGTTEENARARAHRGRVALHKIMSRLAVMLAFIIPGLRRTTHAAGTATTEQAAGAGLSDHTVSIATQLTSHAMTSAPMMSRLAEAASGFPAGKSALAAAAITAVAAVSVPVAVHTVHDAETPSRPPAAVASPTAEHQLASGAADPTGTSTTSSSTSSTLPQSQLHPFAPTLDTEIAPHKADQASTTTTSTTVAPTGTGPVLEGHLSGDALTASGSAPNYDLQGPITLSTGKRVVTGTLEGRIYVFEDGSAKSEGLTLSVGGKTLELRFRGAVQDASSSPRHIVGTYVLSGASDVDLAERGDLVADLLLRDDGTASLTFDLRGRRSS